jgi:hyperosmotically inducible periplasmic protein
MRTPAMILSTSLLVSALIAPVVAGCAFAQATVRNVAADNSAQNQRDRNHQNLTPLDQSNKPADLEMTRNIRRALVKDDQLSTEAKNIKIITVNGAVTLRGPVKTDQEKAAVMEKAAQVAGDTNIHGQLQVARQ